MKPYLNNAGKGFTLVELMVVMMIIGIMLTLATTVLRETGTARSLDSGVDMLQNLVQEARVTAQGNDTYTRLVIANDPKDTSKNSRHLRYMVVQIFRKNAGQAENYDGTSVTMNGEWVSTSAGITLPPGVYFSPSYSRTLSWAEGRGDKINTGNAALSRDKSTRVYYFEFDEKGRYVSPSASPNSPSQPHRLVLINARRGTGRDAKDGIVPLQLDNSRYPLSAKGIVLWPAGNTSLLRTREQIFHH